MKLIKLISLFLIGMFIFAGCSLKESTGPEGGDNSKTFNLKINEFMASNDAAVADPEDDGSGDGSPFDDWIEIYNAGSVAVNIGGMYVTDNLDDLKAWQIPTTEPDNTTIEPDSFLVLWADAEPQQGVLHLDIKLSGKGENIALVESNGLTIIDSYTYGPQQTDASEGRNPDGSDNWTTYLTPSPGTTNPTATTNMPPFISKISVSPDAITDSTVVTISAEATDLDGKLESFTLTYGEKGAINNTKNMLANVAAYEREIGPFDHGKVIYFYLAATDDSSATTISDTLSFGVGYVPPVLFINEFLASNDSCCTDEYGEYDDWIEVYNPGPDAVDVGGMYITDDLAALTTWQIPTTAPDSTTIQPNGFLLLWADKQSEQGVLHVEIKLSGSGEQIGLTAPNGTTLLDSLTYQSQSADTSYGRFPDGSENWQLFTVPTPGTSNQ